LTFVQLFVLFTLAALWGSSFIFIRIAVEPFGPALLMFLRVAISGALLLGYAGWRRQALPIRGYWRKFLLLGFLGSALPFTLIAWAELTVSASIAAILMSTTPLFTSMIAAVGLGERLTLRKVCGALLGIVGVALAVGGSPMSLNGQVLAAVLALLCATLCYALGGVYAKREFVGLSGLSLSSGQLLAAAVLLAPVAAFDLPHELPAGAAILALLTLALLCTVIAYQLYFYLIISAGPSQALTVTLLSPVFGVIFGALLLQEEVSPSMALGLFVVLGSVLLVTGIRRTGRLGRRLARS